MRVKEWLDEDIDYEILFSDEQKSEPVVSDRHHVQRWAENGRNRESSLRQLKKMRKHQG